MNVNVSNPARSSYVKIHEMIVKAISKDLLGISGHLRVMGGSMTGNFMS